MGKIIGWIAVIVIGLAIFGNSNSAERDDSGTVIESGNVDVFKIKFGDCLTEQGLELTSEESTVSESFAVPCNQPHMYQTYFVGQMSSADYSENIPDIADNMCYEEFENYFGISILDTTVSYVSLYPTLNSWNNSDREVTCLLYNDDESLLTESVL